MHTVMEHTPKLSDIVKGMLAAQAVVLNVCWHSYTKHMQKVYRDHAGRLPGINILHYKYFA